MKSCALAFAVLLSLPLPSPAQEMKLPVFFLRYDGGAGFEDMEPEELEEEKMELSSQRHKVTLRIKEQWSDAFTTNLYSAVSSKEYSSRSGSYLYYYLNPDFTWDLNDRLQWSSAFRYKRTDFLDRDDDPTNLLAKTEFTVKLLDDLKVTPFVQGVFDLHPAVAVEKTQQTYTAGLSVESRLGRETRLSGRYRAIARLPLGEGSEVDEYVNHEFGLNLSWDPNK